MRQDKKKKNKSAAGLVLCFCLMALVSVMAVQASINKIQSNMRSTQAADVVKQKAVDAEEDSTDEAGSDVVDSRGSSEPEAETASEYIFPVNGDIIKEHSMDMPVYWETLDQYMTHSGIDIAAEPGTQVQACAAGTVTKIEEDDEMGITVEINHGDDIISVYSNLSSADLIELGEIVSQGTVIGRVGQSSMFEFKDPDHLHFEMKRSDAPADPMDFL